MPRGRLLRPKSPKMERCYLSPAALGPTWEILLHRTPPKTPNDDPKIGLKWNQNGINIGIQFFNFNWSFNPIRKFIYVIVRNNFFVKKN